MLPCRARQRERKELSLPDSPQDLAGREGVGVLSERHSPAWKHHFVAFCKPRLRTELSVKVSLLPATPSDFGALPTHNSFVDVPSLPLPPHSLRNRGVTSSGITLVLASAGALRPSYLAHQNNSISKQTFI